MYCDEKVMKISGLSIKLAQLLFFFHTLCNEFTSFWRFKINVSMHKGMSVKFTRHSQV